MIYAPLEKSLLTKRMAIVGSAKFSLDQSENIDKCDFVLRFNECKNFGYYCGERTDAICVTNTGIPADRIITSKSILRSKYYKSLSEVWFPRNCDVHSKHFPADYSDKTKRIMVSNNLTDKKIIRFGKAFNIFVFDLLKRHSSTAFKCPSTGIFGILYSLYDVRFSGYDKYIFGFRFQGSDWHPWESEKNIVMGLCHSRLDLHFVEM